MMVITECAQMYFFFFYKTFTPLLKSISINVLLKFPLIYFQRPFQSFWFTPLPISEKQT